jgi:hypothetical protein
MAKFSIPVHVHAFRLDTADDEDDRLCAELIHSSVVPAGNDPMVQVLSASLVLSGNLGVATYSEKFVPSPGSRRLFLLKSDQKPISEFIYPEFRYDIESELAPGQPIFCFYILPDL